MFDDQCICLNLEKCIYAINSDHIASLSKEYSFLSDNHYRNLLWAEPWYLVPPDWKVVNHYLFFSLSLKWHVAY
uniref:Uncharacterized protein n=1 Tax=Aegilops tauschii subsp. strangulata TaxID=200361 RepID=A0A453IGS6_AEGTS